MIIIVCQTTFAMATSIGFEEKSLSDKGEPQASTLLYVKNFIIDEAARREFCFEISMVAGLANESLNDDVSTWEILDEDGLVFDNDNVPAYFKMLSGLLNNNEFDFAEFMTQQHAERVGWSSHQNLNTLATRQLVCTGLMCAVGSSMFLLKLIDVNKNLTLGLASSVLIVSAVGSFFPGGSNTQYVPYGLLSVIQYYIDQSFANACNKKNYAVMNYLLKKNEFLPLPSASVRNKACMILKTNKVSNVSNYDI